MTEEYKPPNNYIIWDSLYILQRCTDKEAVKRYLKSLNLTPRHMVECVETGIEVPAIEFMQQN